jgi:hypothetical protein
MKNTGQNFFSLTVPLKFKHLSVNGWWNGSIWQLCAVLRIRDPGFWFLTIPDPGSRISDPGSRIQDPKTAIKEMGEKISCHTFVCNHKFHKILNYFIFWMLKKKMWANFQRIIELFSQNIVTKLSKIWVWDPESGKNLFRIADPESRGQKAPDPGSATLQVVCTVLCGANPWLPDWVGRAGGTVGGRAMYPLVVAAPAPPGKVADCSLWGAVLGPLSCAPGIMQTCKTVGKMKITQNTGKIK